MKLESSELVKYNANNRGSSVGDCTARAISLAFNMDYSKARKALNDSAKENWRNHWDYNSTDNVRRVVEALGGGKDIREPNKITLNNWVDAHPSGTYIIHCNKNGLEQGPGGHLVCVIDGKIYDSWDSRSCYVLSYHIISKGIKGSDITDIGAYLREWIHHRDAQGYKDYATQIFDSIISKNRKLKKFADEYGVDFHISFEVIRVVLDNYTFKFEYKIALKIPDYNFNKTFEGKFAIVFKPTMSKDQVDSYFEETFYSKLYSFIQGNVIYTVEDVCSGRKLLEHPERGLPEEVSRPYDPWDTFSMKSFKNLPYWVRRLTTYFNRRNPFEGGYHDSIELTIYTPPFDTKYGEDDSYYISRADEREFHAYNMNDLLAGLEYYKKTGDYEKAYEIAADY